MFTLRPDQLQATEDLRQALRNGAKAPLFQAATGYGKTVWFASIVKTAIEKQKRVLILCHRIELLDQISETLHQFDVPHSFIAAQYPYNPWHQVQVCSVFTLIQRVSKIPKPDLIIIDEAHHAIKESTWGKILQHYHGVLRIGVTATPYRTSGEPLNDLFDCLIQGPTPRSLMDAGILSDYRLFAPTRVNLHGIHKRGGDYAKNELDLLMDKPSITGDAIATYRKFAEGKRAVAFCVSVQHAHHTAEAFLKAGFNAMALDGDMDKADRKERVRLFRTGAVQILTSCEILSEGFDVKGIEAGIFLRPTESLTLWLQQLGRCLRAMPGKQYALLLDHANNAVRHGLPDDAREWSLEGNPEAKSKEKQKTPVRQCKKCYAVVALSAIKCIWCGTVFEVKPRKVAERDGELEEVQPSLYRQHQSDDGLGGEQGYRKRKEVREAETLADLQRIARQRNYSPRWAYVQWNLRKRKSRATSMMIREVQNGSNLSGLADAYRPKRKSE